MTSRYRTFVFLLVGLAAGAILSPVLFHDIPRDTEIIVERHDTVTVTDTHFMDFPVVVDVEISDDSLKIPLQPIIIRNDSLIVLPIEVKTYEGDCYKAQVSGYNPRLDWIEVYPKTQYITTEKSIKKPTGKWGIGIQAGYGLGISSGKITHGPYVGIGISYNLFSF